MAAVVICGTIVVIPLTWCSCKEINNIAKKAQINHNCHQLRNQICNQIMSEIKAEPEPWIGETEFPISFDGHPFFVKVVIAESGHIVTVCSNGEDGIKNTKDDVCRTQQKISIKHLLDDDQSDPAG
jgi:hypothetical protein